mmetsp:Transcript_25199/g.62413  ORF Transcript_25199/g.62413 Transcript_25199/m.62413 type:complete len:205 (+) Transcript_25199:4174-4788(+)
MSRCPPEKPRQLAKIISGSSSWLMSAMPCAVLYALSGYHTCPARESLISEVEGMAGSAGWAYSVTLVSTQITPTGMPPRRARPTMTDLAQSIMTSLKVPRSKMPLCHWPVESLQPVSMSRGSSVDECGLYCVALLMGSEVSTIMGGGPSRCSGTKDSQSRIAWQPSMSSLTVRCDTPFLYMTSIPPISSLLVYTSRPIRRFSAW